MKHSHVTGLQRRAEELVSWTFGERIRDHKPFRELLAAGFADCADSSQNWSWPGFTWPLLHVMVDVEFTRRT